VCVCVCVCLGGGGGGEVSPVCFLGGGGVGGVGGGGGVVKLHQLVFVFTFFGTFSCSFNLTGFCKYPR